MNSLKSFPLAICIILCACENDNLPSTAVQGNYYPLSNAGDYYLQESFNSYTKQVLRADTIKIAYVGDVKVTSNNKTYNKLDFFFKYHIDDSHTAIDQVQFQLVRKDGSKYFETSSPSDSSEFIFLDTEWRAGDSWVYYSGSENENKKIRTVKGVNEKKVVNGVEYENVIEVLDEWYAKSDSTFYLSSSAQSYFAKDKGRIYISTECSTCPSSYRTSLLKK